MLGDEAKYRQWQKISSLGAPLGQALALYHIQLAKAFLYVELEQE